MTILDIMVVKKTIQYFFPRLLFLFKWMVRIYFSFSSYVLFLPLRQTTGNLARVYYKTQQTKRALWPSFFPSRKNNLASFSERPSNSRTLLAEAAGEMGLAFLGLSYYLSPIRSYWMNQTPVKGCRWYRIWARGKGKYQQVVCRLFLSQLFKIYRY